MHKLYLYTIKLLYYIDKYVISNSFNVKIILEEMLSSKTGFWLVLFLFKKSTFCLKRVLFVQKECFLLKNSAYCSKNPYFGQKFPILVKKS